MAIVFGQKIFLMVYLRHCSTSNEYELVQNKHFLFLYLWQNLPYTWLGHFEWKIQIPDIFWNFSSKTFFLHIFLPIPMVWQPQIYNIRNICQCNNNISIKIYLFLFYLVYEHNLAGLFPFLYPLTLYEGSIMAICCFLSVLDCTKKVAVMAKHVVKIAD